MDDATLAAKLAHTAGRILLELRASAMFEGRALGKAGDETANRFLVHALRHQRPDDGLLSEEEKDNHDRLAKSRVWIIDPVDGTREFGEERSDWAVHVGLAIDGVPQCGAVALPGLDSAAGANAGANADTGANAISGRQQGLVLRSDQPAELPKPNERPRLVVSRTRPAHEAVEIAQRIGGELIAMGSAGAKAMALVRGEAEIYLHSGGQYEWDSCAPVAVAMAHGLHCSRLDGSPLIYNRQDTYLPDLLICRQEWAETILAEVAKLK